jgi:hypothetical protein
VPPGGCEREWLGDEGFILIQFSSEGRVAGSPEGGWAVERFETVEEALSGPPTLWERVCDWVGW